MGQLCFREEQDIKQRQSKHKNGNLGVNLVDQAPNKQMAYRFSMDNFENITHEKKYFFSMFFYNKIQKKILKLSHVSKKNSHEISSFQIQKLCASLGQYISYLQMIQEKFQLFDQVYEESEKGYLESDAYSLTLDDSLRNISYTNNHNGSTHPQSCGTGGLSAKKFTLAKQMSQGSVSQFNNNSDNKSHSLVNHNNIEDNTDAHNNYIIDNNQSTQSTNNSNQILPKFDSQDIKNHLLEQRMSALKTDEKQPEDDIDKMIVKVSNSCGSVLLYDMGGETDQEKSNMANSNNSNNINIENNNHTNSGHFSNCDKEQHLQTINEESSNINNLLFNSNLLPDSSLLQLGDSNMLSQISINDLQNALPNYEVSEIFGRISERLKQPLLIFELHKIQPQTKTKVGSFRVQMEVLFEDGSKRQKQTFSTSQLIQNQNNDSKQTEINISEVFEFLSEISLTNTAYTKFRVSIYYTALKKSTTASRKGSEESSPQLRKKNNSQSSNSPDSKKKQQKGNGSIGSNGGYGEDKQVLSCESSSSSSSSQSFNNNINMSNANNKNNSNTNKNISSTNTALTTVNEDSRFNSNQTEQISEGEEIRLSSQVFNLKDYMDQEIHYLNLKFTNKSAKQKIVTNPIKVDLQARFQFVFDQNSLVNNLMNDLTQQKTILEEILTNLYNNNNNTTSQNNQNNNNDNIKNIKK